jgi:hypothetical protein
MIPTIAAFTRNRTHVQSVDLGWRFGEAILLRREGVNGTLRPCEPALMPFGKDRSLLSKALADFI